jgi:anti-sigma regulatory factor (Ser/Thr protein kinase)
VFALVEGAAGLSAARAHARRVCVDNAVSDDRCDAVELVLSELLGNACRHGGDPVSYETWLDAPDVLVAVADGERLPPVENPHADDDAEGGRGLFLVGAVSKSWGWDATPSGKQVWARV